MKKEKRKPSLQWHFGHVIKCGSGPGGTTERTEKH